MGRIEEELEKLIFKIFFGSKSHPIINGLIRVLTSFLSN